MSNEHIEELNDQQIVRREKMAHLAEQGIDPFGKRFERTATSGQLKDKYADKTKEELHDINQTAIIAGRLMTKRGKGLLISKTVMVKSKYTSAKTLLEKKTTKFSKKQTLVTSLVLKGKSCVQTWVN